MVWTVNIIRRFKINIAFEQLFQEIFRLVVFMISQHNAAYLQISQKYRKHFKIANFIYLMTRNTHQIPDTPLCSAGPCHEVNPKREGDQLMAISPPSSGRTFVVGLFAVCHSPKEQIGGITTHNEWWWSCCVPFVVVVIVRGGRTLTQSSDDGSNNQHLSGW